MRSALPSPPDSLPGVNSGWRAIARNSFWLLLEKTVRWALGLTVGVWTARYLGPADFGLFAATIAWVALFGGAAGLGIEPIVVRELIRRPADRSTLLATAFGLRMGGGVLATGFAILAAALWSAASPPLVLTAIASLATLFAVGEVFDLWFQANLQARAAALARTAAFALACLGRIALITQGAPVAAFLWLSVIEAALTSAVLAGVFFRAQPLGGGRFSPAIARALLGESWPNLVANLASMSYLRADRVMLASLAGDSAAGRYSAAATLVEIWYVFPIAIVNSATPFLTQLHSTDLGGFHREFARLARLHSAGAWALVIVLATTAPWLVPVLYGSAYEPAVGTLQLLACSLPFAFLGVVASPWYLNAHLTRVSMGRHLLGAGLNLGLNLLFIPRWGPLGSAGATVIAFAVAHVFANAFDARTRPLLRLQLRALTLLPTRLP